MFRVANHDYEITSAHLTLSASTEDDCIGWGVKIITAKRARQSGDDMSTWRPAILAEELLETQPGQMAHWFDVAGTTIEWDEPDEDPRALFAVFDTVAIYECKCQFTRMPGVPGVRLLLEGTVDVDVDHRELPLRVDTALTVAPLRMGKRSEQECRDLFRQSGLEDPVEFQIIDGISSLVILNQ